MKKGKPNNDVFFVEKILKHKEKGNKKLYLVKWVDYDEKFNSWEPEQSFLNSEKVLKLYEESTKQAREHNGRMAKTERQLKLTPLSGAVSKPVGARILTRRRKPTYKRSLIEKPQNNCEQAASVSNRSTPESSVSAADAQSSNNSLNMRTKRRGGRSRKHHFNVEESQEVKSSTVKILVNNEDVEIEDATLNKALNGKKNEEDLDDSANTSGDYPFELHRHNGLIGEDVNKDRIDQLIKEMDESLERVDGYAIVDEASDYSLSRLILIAKRPLGMIAYVRLEHNTDRSFRFECVPLEILIAKYPDDVLEYLQDQMKMDALNEYRRQARERFNESKANGDSKLPSNSNS
ncbi:Chromobox 2 [Aphelenchoides bicaudatus]|nr:Chromobox 2 [Aphelenchoides bicaudatus]